MGLTVYEFHTIGTQRSRLMQLRSSLIVDYPVNGRIDPTRILLGWNILAIRGAGWSKSHQNFTCVFFVYHKRLETHSSHRPYYPNTQ